jgi:hypothetical protein
VAEDDDRVPLIDLVVLLRVEDPPERRLHAKHREVVPRYHLGLDALGSVVHADGRRHEAAAQDVGKRLRPLLEVLVDGIGVHPRSHVAAVVIAQLVQHDQFLGCFHRELAQQNLVDEGEDCGIGADAKRE